MHPPLSRLTLLLLAGCVTALLGQCARNWPVGDAAPRHGGQAIVAGYLSGDPPHTFRIRKTIYTEEDARNVFEMCADLVITDNDQCYWFDKSSLRVRWDEKQKLFIGTGSSLKGRDWAVRCVMSVKQGGNLLKYKKTTYVNPNRSRFLSWKTRDKPTDSH